MNEREQQKLTPEQLSKHWNAHCIGLALEDVQADRFYQDEIDEILQVAIYLHGRVAALEAALAPFAAVGAAVAARPAYPPTQTIMRVGEASFTVAHLIAAADVLAVRAEAVTGSVGTGISEIMEDAK